MQAFQRPFAIRTLMRTPVAHPLHFVRDLGPGPAQLPPVEQQPHQFPGLRVGNAVGATVFVADPPPATARRILIRRLAPIPDEGLPQNLIAAFHGRVQIGEQRQQLGLRRVRFDDAAPIKEYGLSHSAGASSRWCQPRLPHRTSNPGW